VLLPEQAFNGPKLQRENEMQCLLVIAMSRSWAKEIRWRKACATAHDVPLREASPASAWARAHRKATAIHRPMVAGPQSANHFHCRAEGMGFSASSLRIEVRVALLSEHVTDSA
jgi:hypothetical protein